LSAVRQALTQFLEITLAEKSLAWNHKRKSAGSGKQLVKRRSFFFFSFAAGVDHSQHTDPGLKANVVKEVKREKEVRV
jgi:hypothetical protein